MCICFNKRNPPLKRTQLSFPVHFTFTSQRFVAQQVLPIVYWHVMMNNGDNVSSLAEFAKTYEGSRKCTVTGKGVSHSLEGDTQLVLEVVLTCEIIEAAKTTCLEEEILKAKISIFEDGNTTEVTTLIRQALKSFNWMKYGLTFHGSQQDSLGNNVIELTGPGHIKFIDIVLHKHHDKTLNRRKKQSNSASIKEALGMALDNLKAKNATIFLSNRSNKIKKYAPDLSRSISALIFSSNDKEFQEECSAILGILPTDFSEEKIDACINERICDIIEMSDNVNKRKTKKALKRKLDDSNLEKEGDNTKDNEELDDYRSIWDYL